MSDDETWSLDTSLARLILPRLKRFRELNNGFPPHFTMETWNAAIDHMIEAFEFYASEEQYNCTERSIHRRAEKGVMLFGRHFKHLWW